MSTKKRRFGSGRPMRGRKKVRLTVEDHVPNTTSRKESIDVERTIHLHLNKDGRIGQTTSRSIRMVSSVESESSQQRRVSVSSDVVQSSKTRKHARRARPDLRSSSKIELWKKECRQPFLDELILQDGPSSTEGSMKCSECSSVADFRCLHCFLNPAMCQDCLLDRHALQPLHRIEYWNGKYFEKTTLSAAGIRVQLGHSHDNCRHPSKESKICVVDISGLHYLLTHYCECSSGRDLPQWQQLLRAQWFPATNKRPRTVFTFRVLDFFHQLTVQSKANLFDFYNTLERLTDNTEGETSNYRHSHFMHVMRLWRHLKMLKRAGRGHDPNGVDATTQGELAVECPACPQPGRNLPDDWDQHSESVGWIYTLFLMLDANFRIRCKDRGLKDSELSPGWAYFVEESRYLGHVAKHADIEDVNTCSAEHSAIIKANLRKKGYVASGVGAVLCGRHALVRKNGVGDLQKGEKFCNMDYLLLLTLISTAFFWLLITYDIACSFYKNFNKRVDRYRDDLKLDFENMSIRWAIPKEHLPVHGPNHSRFSLNFLPRVGRTYGEGIESNWGHINPVSLSAQEMGPGMRHEVLDDHWGAWNWRKIICLGSHLLRCHREAVEMHEEQQDAFDDFSDLFDADIIKDWEEILDTWNKNPRAKPDPYEEPTAAMTMVVLRQQLAEEDAADASRGRVEAHEVSLKSFMQLGLDLEEQIRSMPANTSRSISNRTRDQEKRNTIIYRVRAWRKIQNVYMPLVICLREPNAIDEEEECEDEDNINSDQLALYLPSSLPTALCAEESLQALLSLERRLRIAQADDALDEIRRLRRVLQRVAEFRRLNVAGNGAKPSTRIRSLYDRFQRRVERAAATYRVARLALLGMNAEDPELHHFKELKPEHITGPGRDRDGPGEGRYELSWIWRIRRSGSGIDTANITPDDLVSARVEWARSKARAERWREETVLLEEEMRRTIEFFRWKASWWRDRRDARDASIALSRGLNAYAEKQAAMFDGLALKFAHLWMPYLHALGQKPSWFEYFPQVDLASLSLSSDSTGSSSE